MQMKKILLMSAAVTALAVPATAQELERGQSVGERARPASEQQIGMRLGSFQLMPSLVVGEKFDDNVFRTENREKSDLISTIAPTIRLKSDWGRHALNFQTGGEFGFFVDNNSENYKEFNAGVDGRVDIARESSVDLAFKYERLHEDRSSPDSPGAASEPTDYDMFTARAGAVHAFNRLSLKVDGGVAASRYDDPSAIGGGEIEQGGRDRNVYDVGAKATYELQSTVKPFLEYRHNFRRYQSDASAALRDSQGFRANIGTTLDFGGKVTGDIFAGVLYQDPELAGASDVIAPNFGAGLLWQITGLTSAKLSVNRTFEETTTGGASGYVSSAGRVDIDHELSRSILLNGNLGYTNNDYEGTNREEHIFQTGVGATYILNRNLSLGGDYTFRKRDVNVATADYTSNVFVLRLTGKL